MATETKEIDKTVDRFNLPEALRLRVVHGMTYPEIAKKYGTSKQRVHQQLQPFLKLTGDPETLKTYQENRATFFDGLSLKLLKQALTSGVIDRANLGEISTSIERLYKLMRLETNQSTENVAETVKVVPSDAVDRLDKILNSDSQKD